MNQWTTALAVLLLLLAAMLHFLLAYVSPEQQVPHVLVAAGWCVIAGWLALLLPKRPKP
jgi:hypothetical protein